MTQIAFEAWLSLYAAVGILAAMCAVMAVAYTGFEIQTGRLALPMQSVRQRLLEIPRIWLRWQFNYLRGVPAIMAISLMFANHVGFSDFTAF